MCAASQMQLIQCLSKVKGIFQYTKTVLNIEIIYWEICISEVWYEKL